jgi:hypothetical protein
MRRIGMILAALLALLPSTAFSDTAWEAFARFGGAGTWALSCRDAPSPENPWMIYFKDANGAVRRTMNRGSDKRHLIVTIDRARRVTATTMEVFIRNDDPDWGSTNGVVVDVILIKENGRMRTLESKGSDGKEYIKHGVVVASGNPIPWIEKCRNN